VVEETYRQLCQQLIDQWRQEKVPLNPGATEQELAAFENRLALRLPADFRYFYSLANGMTNSDTDKFFFNLWSFSQMLTTREGIVCKDDPVNNKTEIVFGDYLIDSHRYRLLIDKTGQACVNCQLNNNEIIADSFTHFVHRYLSEPEQIHLYLL
jgi:hypothetical protein